MLNYFSSSLLPLTRVPAGSVFDQVGEPIAPSTWDWFHKEVGGSRAPIVDTYWQTETGGIVLCTLPGAAACKPGSAGLPFFGIVPR